MKKLFVIPFSYLAILLISSFGSCQQSENDTCIEQTFDPTIFCTFDYNPVCGCNGITYSNSCMANGYGITEFTPGACPTSQNCVEQPANPTMMCAADYDPVCGCNGVTYSNSCMAELVGITGYTQGECVTYFP